MRPGRTGGPLLAALAAAVLALTPSTSRAQLPPVLNPGDRHQFFGADVDADLSSGCDGVVNGCGVDYGDLSANSPRMYVSSVVNVGVLGTTRSATGRLVHPFTVSPGPDHRIGAKLIGVVRWRGWLQADFGAYDNTSSALVGVSLYDVTDGTRRLVANQRVNTSSVGGTLSIPPIPNFERDIGSGGFDLAVDLERGHDYLAAVEATCTSTSGVLGIFTAASFSTFGNGIPVLTDGFIEQTSMTITLEPDYIALIDELREEFEGHTHTYLTGRGVGHNNTEAATSTPIEDSPPPLVYLPGDGPAVEPTLEMVTAAPDHVALFARVPQGAESPSVERRTGESEWSPVASVSATGTVEDAGVSPGARYGYRLRATILGQERTSEEVWVDIPTRLLLGLEETRPNPVGRNLNVAFTLPSRDQATLTLFDVQGRVVMTREVASLGAGRHVIDWGTTDRIANGIYFLRLSQSGHSVATKVVVLR